ncbi:MAG: biopolymer transporter ExbD [Proteobacteria bacterium]|nr:biopolymer transporter ExbD [Pseudomonadota bacterium]MBQ4359357.1 biopolymer transporter ExbD [Pseudomonadota bacterium]
MNLTRSQASHKPTLDITPLIDVVFLLLVFLLLTMTFTEEKPDLEEAIIDIELAKSSTTETPNPAENITLLIDEKGSLYRSDSAIAQTTDDLKLYLAEKLLASPDMTINVKSDHRTRHGQVIEALDLLKSLGIKRVNLVIEKNKE